MSNKGFTMLVVGVLVLGVGIGGSFLAGTVVGGGTEDVAAAEVAPASNAADTFAQLREQVQSGQVSQEDLAELRQQFQGEAGAGRLGGGAFGGTTGAGGDFVRPGGADAALFGTVGAVDGNVVTLDTPQGQLQVTVNSATAITQTVDAAVGDLAEGMQLTVNGERAEDGSVEATVIRVIPAGDGGFGGGGFVRGGFGGRGGGTNGGGG